MTEKLSIPTTATRRRSYIWKILLGTLLLAIFLISIVIVLFGDATVGQVTSSSKNNTNDVPPASSVVQPNPEAPTEAISEEATSQTTDVYINGTKQAVPESGGVTRVIQDDNGTTSVDVVIDSRTSGSANSTTSTTMVQTHSTNESYYYSDEADN